MYLNCDTLGPKTSSQDNQTKAGSPVASLQATLHPTHGPRTLRRAIDCRLPTIRDRGKGRGERERLKSAKVVVKKYLK